MQMNIIQVKIKVKTTLSSLDVLANKFVPIPDDTMLIKTETIETGLGVSELKGKFIFYAQGVAGEIISAKKVK
jgi:hypothetical protein